MYTSFIICSFVTTKLTLCAGLIILDLLTTPFVFLDVVGDFGWFFGDFFIQEDAFDHHLCYTGIYRFLVDFFVFCLCVLAALNKSVSSLSPGYLCLFLGLSIHPIHPVC